MLSSEQIKNIASDLNGKVNIPLMAEGQEQEMLESALGTMNSQLSVVVNALPDSVKEVWDRIQDGVSDAEAEALKTQLATDLNEKVNIPFLGEGQEMDMLISPAVDLIVETVRSQTGK
ncbi:MAG: hypothetical protein AAF702_48180 [Chloroflexota bacterium]